MTLNVGRIVGRVSVLLVVLPAMAPAQIASADARVRAMHDRYRKSWYSTITFTQKSTTYNDDGTTKVETWYEAAMLPGELRIDVGEPGKGNGALMVDGTGYFFRDGKQVGTRPYLNLLLVLGFDVYGQAPQKT